MSKKACLACVISLMTVYGTSCVAAETTVADQITDASYTISDDAELHYTGADKGYFFANKINQEISGGHHKYNF